MTTPDGHALHDGTRQHVAVEGEVSWWSLEFPLIIIGPSLNLNKQAKNVAYYMYVGIMHPPYCMRVCHFLHISVYTVCMNVQLLACTTPPCRGN